MKKILSVLLAVIMVVGIVPGAVFAAQTNTPCKLSVKDVDGNEVTVVSCDCADLSSHATCTYTLPALEGYENYYYTFGATNYNAGDTFDGNSMWVCWEHTSSDAISGTITLVERPTSDYVAAVGGFGYKDLQEAINAAEAGQKVSLLADVTSDTEILVNKSITLDLGVYTITNAAEGIPGALYVRPENGTSIDVVINATTGGIVATGNSYAVNSGNINDDDAKTTLTINGGNYVAEGDCAIYQNNGVAIINGGTYQAADKQLVLNNKDYYLGEFVVNGGSFYGFNPACMSINKNYHHDHNSIAEGMTAVYEDGWYTVVEGESSFVAQISSTYESLDRCCFSLLEAVNEAEAGNTITLLEDITLTEKVVYAMPENSTLDLNGKTLTIKQDTAKFAGKNITITNGTVVAYNSKTNYPLYIGDGSTKTTATVKNLTVNGGGVYVKNYATVTLKDNEIVVGSNKWKYALIVEDKGDAIILSGKYFGGKDGHDIMAWKNNIDVYGGTFKYQHVKNFVADGYAAAKVADGTYIVVSEDEVVASAGSINYLDLQVAIDDAKSGATVKLAKDVEASETILIDKKLTLDLGEYTINSTAAKNVLYSTADLTINATTGGIFSETACVAVGQDNGVCTINGGSFKATGNTGDHANGKPVYNSQVLNNSDFYEGVTGSFVINGGKFYGFNPGCMSINKGDHHDHDSIAAGKIATLDADGWFTVVEGEFAYKVVCDCKYPASAHQHCFATYAEAEQFIGMMGNCSYDKIVEIAA